MDWYAYLSLAKELAEPEEGLSHNEIQARQRSAVSRAYYAIFCTARDIFDPDYRSRSRENGSSHANLWKKLKNDPDREEVRYIGEQAALLGESRRQADYEEFIMDLPYFVEGAIASAEDLKEALEAF